ncbi:MAG: hypothetical protein KGJ79_02905 [Alphaproteobacteria bacterium]|nr:hypothetical protein [Alphaproteobacteria bacterium]MDE2110065.1 hypothetical protein [Alphaproteobacteria bacterium]MDE2492996.1 hypothetical protein [Alphaproteobacteria bacterium]
MEYFANTLKTAALAGLLGLGAMAATATPALAHQVYTRCDRDGDTCYRVLCDDDGDDCRTIRSFNRDTYWNDSYGRGYGYYRGYGRSNYRGRWVCDGDGDRCRWVSYYNNEDDDDD